MKKVLGIFMVILFFTGCISNSDNQDKASSNSAQNIVSKATSSSSVESTSSTDLSPQEKFKAVHEDSALNSYDFETAYAMCVQAISEFQSAKKNETEMNFSDYIVNPDLINYLEKELHAPRNAHGLVGDYEVNRTGIAKYEYQPTDKQDRLYLKVVFGSASSSSPVDFIVENHGGRLVISEWYFDTKDSFDIQCRGLIDIQNADIYWDNFDKEALSARVEEVIKLYE